MKKGKERAKIIKELLDITDKEFTDEELIQQLTMTEIVENNSNEKTTILDAQNYIKNKETPNFSVAATTNEGMFATEDDLGTSYYFRGAVDNNWVKFGKENGKYIYWRIIRINGDNSVRMIYSGTTPPISSTSIVMTGTGTQIGTGKFNNANTCN